MGPALDARPRENDLGPVEFSTFLLSRPSQLIAIGGRILEDIATPLNHLALDKPAALPEIGSHRLQTSETPPAFLGGLDFETAHAKLNSSFQSN